LEETVIPFGTVQQSVFGVDVPLRLVFGDGDQFSFCNFFLFSFVETKKLYICSLEKN